jgi:hypothetical protein
MPGFRFCSWCSGKGCICCDAEEAKYAAKAAAAPKWRPPDIRDVRDQALRDETHRLESLIGKTIGSWGEFQEAEAAAHAEIEAAFQPALDAEYVRQFPNGPEPMFTARLNNPDDLKLLRQVAGGPALDRAFADGVTNEAVREVGRKLAEARIIQAARQALCPNEADLATTDGATS